MLIRSIAPIIIETLKAAAQMSNAEKKPTVINEMMPTIMVHGFKHTASVMSNGKMESTFADCDCETSAHPLSVPSRFVWKCRRGVPPAAPRRGGVRGERSQGRGCRRVFSWERVPESGAFFNLPGLGQLLAHAATR